MSIQTAKAEIRAARKLQGPITGPWKILSSDGSYHHRLLFDEDAADVICVTCTERYNHNRCWGRARVLRALAEAVAATKEGAK